MLYELAEPGHPAGKFTWGNMESLKKTTDITSDNPYLYENLKVFHKKFYNAKSMNLVLQSSATLGIDCSFWLDLL